MMINVMRKVAFRPITSPNRDQTSAPSGLTTNPTPNVSSANTVCAAGG